MTDTAIESIETLDFDYVPPCEYNDKGMGCLFDAPADVITICRYCARQRLACNGCLRVYMKLVVQANGFECTGCGPHHGDIIPFYITPLK